MEKINPGWAKDIPCRNVIIYGYCKKQKDGCPFKHDNDLLDNNATVNTTTTSNTNNNIGLSTATTNKTLLTKPSLQTSSPTLLNSTLQSLHSLANNHHSNLNNDNNINHNNNIIEFNFESNNTPHSTYLFNSTNTNTTAHSTSTNTNSSNNFQSPFNNTVNINTTNLPQLSQLPSLLGKNNGNNNNTSTTASNPANNTSSITNQDTILGTPKFNAKHSARFIPTNTTNNTSNITNSPNVSIGNGLLSLSLNGNDSNKNTISNGSNTTTNNDSNVLNFTPTFNAYKAESFTPMSSTINLNLDIDNNDSNNTNTNAINHSINNNNSYSPISSNISINNNLLNNNNNNKLNRNDTNANINDTNNIFNTSNDSTMINNQSLDVNNTLNSINTNTVTTANSASINGKFNFPQIYPPPHSILQYHLYAPDAPPQLKLPLKPNERTNENLFIPNNLRESLVKKNLASLQIFPPIGNSIPDIINDYFGLVPIDFHEKNPNDINYYKGHKNSLFKVFSNRDGKIYCLRRIHNLSVKFEPNAIAKIYNNWSKLKCSNIVNLKDIFVTTKFGDQSLCLVYDYFPNSISIYESHFINYPLLPITEKYLWSYCVQLINAIRSAHNLNLNLNNLLNWNKIIVTGDPGIIKISSIGSMDLFNLENDENFKDSNDNDKDKLQLDFVKLGELLIKLASSIVFNDKTKNINKSTNIDELAIDDDFKTVLKYLVDNENKNKSVKELISLTYDKFFDTLDSVNNYSEFLINTLSKELENSRLFRIMCKLNFIFGRIESRIDINWSESGEKFPIILFYEFVFHQFDEFGKPVMDLSHVLRCLNKLDASINEKLVLATADEMNCIIISYKELKDLIESTFRSLTQTNI